MTVAWFRYERNFASRWCPVVLYNDSRPTIPKHDADRITAAVAVPADCLASDGSPMFGRLQAIFPAPVNVE